VTTLNSVIAITITAMPTTTAIARAVVAKHVEVVAVLA
jgi:hypothetical protein